jgi:hypothetical protein
LGVPMQGFSASFFKYFREHKRKEGVGRAIY